jgi:hypothetical protein
LKLAPFCIGGNSTAAMASFSTWSWMNTKRQNSYLNQSKYCCVPWPMVENYQVGFRGLRAPHCGGARITRKHPNYWLGCP